MELGKMNNNEKYQIYDAAKRAVLRAISQGKGTLNELSNALMTSKEDLKELLEDLRDNGLVSKDEIKLTKAGLDLVEREKRGLTQPPMTTKAVVEQKAISETPVKEHDELIEAMKSTLIKELSRDEPRGGLIKSTASLFDVLRHWYVTKKISFSLTTEEIFILLIWFIGVVSIMPFKFLGLISQVEQVIGYWTTILGILIGGHLVSRILAK